MKKKFHQFILSAIAAVALINVYIAQTTSSVSDLVLEDVESLAEPELNKWYLWFTQGLTQDESPERYSCTITVKQKKNNHANMHAGDNNYVNGDADHQSETETTITYTGVGERCLNGNTNCNRVSCQ